MKKKILKEKIAPIGGQAVMEGVMMRGNHAMALAVKNPDGEICLETYKLRGKSSFKKIPIIRGCIAFISSLVVGMKMLSRSTEISSTEEESLSKGGMAIALILGLLIAIGIFILIPELLSGILRQNALEGLSISKRVLINSLISGVLRISIFILYLFLCSKMKDVKRTFMYHGAEHKTINCYESQQELTVENIQKCSTIHRRCGTTFLFIVMIVSILIFALANWAFEAWGIVFPENTFLKGLCQMGIKLALLPVVAGISFEILKLFARLPYNLFTKIIMAPGLFLQKLTTAQPDDEMVEVALKSFNACLEMEENPSIPSIKYPERKCGDVLEYLKRSLKKIDAEEAESYWILCHVIGEKRSEISTDRLLSPSEFQKIKEILDRRLEHEPLDYIFGFSEFYFDRVDVSKDVLIPRMETEVLCESVINYINSNFNKAKEPCQVLDLCSGSGCIARAIALNTNSYVTASDICPKTLEIAAKNLKHLPCCVVESNLFEAIDKSFDVIVSNPPYIKSKEIEGLALEVRAQPIIALDGGEDGLDFYRKIIDTAPKHLNKNGKIFFEIGHDQSDSLSTLLAKDFKDIVVIKDLSGSDRVVTASKR